MSLYSAVREVIGMNTHRAGESINVVRCRGLMIGTWPKLRAKPASLHIFLLALLFSESMAEIAPFIVLQERIHVPVKKVQDMSLLRCLIPSEG